MNAPLTFYFSGYSERKFIEPSARLCKARLLSCHGSYMKDVGWWSEVIRGLPEWKERPVMLDSGAFTAWKSGHPTTLDEVSRNYDRALGLFGNSIKECWLINLDVIPGTKGVVPTKEQVDQAVAESDVNFASLQRRFGKRVLPVYHQGESQERLREVCAQSDYIGIGPRQKLPERARVEWVSQTHAHLRRVAPGVRAHGLATTGLRIMNAGGWFSVDSATWLWTAALGGVVIWNGSRLIPVAVSEQSPKRAEWDAHYDTLPPSSRERIDQQRIELGIPDDGLRTTLGWRQVFNLASIQRMSEEGANDRGQSMMEALF